MEKQFLGQIIQIFKYRFNLDDDKATEADVLENIKKSVEFKGINLWTLIFAILIASIGLNVNSTAVIIGAMLVSPLMGPIMGVGFGAGILDFGLIKKAVKNLMIATIIGLVTSTLYFFISPLRLAQSELLARTTPTIWDVLIAFFGGLAGIVASTRKKYNNVIPGVAIATALMPPLCTAGFGIATAQWSYFFGAFYLYLINSVFISIATFLIVRFLKYKSITYDDPLFAKKVRKWVSIIAFLTIVPSLYLAYHFVRNEMFSQNANRLINEEVIARNYTLINKEILPSKCEIMIHLFLSRNSDSLKNILELKKINYNLGDALITVKNNNIVNQNYENINQLKTVVENNLAQKDQEIALQKGELNKLKQKNYNLKQFAAKKEEAIQEFYSLFGKPQELIIEKTLIHNLNNSNDTVLMVYISSKNKSMPKYLSQIDEWLKTKFNVNKTKIILK